MVNEFGLREFHRDISQSSIQNLPALANGVNEDYEVQKIQMEYAQKSEQDPSADMLARNESTTRPFKEKKIMRRKKMSVDPHNASQSLLKSAITHRSKRNISNNMASTFSLYGLNSTGSKAALSPPPGHLKKMADINNF